MEYVEKPEIACFFVCFSFHFFRSWDTPKKFSMTVGSRKAFHRKRQTHRECLTQRKDSQKIPFYLQHPMLIRSV